MQNLISPFAVLGLGLEAVDVIKFLHRSYPGQPIAVFDQQTRSLLRPFINSLPRSKNIHFYLGSNYLNHDLTQFKTIFRSPGFYYLSPLITRLKKTSSVTSAVKVFFQSCPAKIVAVTGTKGKGTTTTLIHRCLLSQGYRSFIAGNIGKPMLELLPKLTKNDWVCLELSSFQLQDFDSRPKIAVVLNITSEHLNVHHSKKEYRSAKANLVKFMTKNDFCVLNHDYQFSRSLKSQTQAQVVYFSRHQPVVGAYCQQGQLFLNLKKPIKIGPANQLLLKGEHNHENITAAMAASALAKVSSKNIRHTVFKFKGLEHRLELVAVKKTVSFYNDSFSTTPETAVAALKSFTQPITIILGGSSKDSDYTQLGREIHFNQYLDKIILIGQTAPQISRSIKAAGGFSGQIITGLKTMKQIVNTANKVSQKNSVVVLSPACASFDMFKNYKDRGQQFKKAVKAL